MTLYHRTTIQTQMTLTRNPKISLLRCWTQFSGRLRSRTLQLTLLELCQTKVTRRKALMKSYIKKSFEIESLCSNAILTVLRKWNSAFGDWHPGILGNWMNQSPVLWLSINPMVIRRLKMLLFGKSVHPVYWDDSKILIKSKCNNLRSSRYLSRADL